MRLSRLYKLAATAASILLLTPGVLMAQGILYPRPEIREQPFFVKSVKVTANITDALAETTVEQTFVNSSSVEQEGTYLFPLPDGATVTSFTLRAGDQALEGRLLTKEEARSIYESIVRRRKDPALLEYMGHGLFRASVFPIPAHGERQLILKYAQVIKPEGAQHKFSYPLSTGRFSTRAIASSVISVRLKSSAPLRAVYSPTHNVSVKRVDDHNATASWESMSEIPDRDFVLYYSSSRDDVGLSLLTSPGSGADGYFMLVASPRFDVPKDRILPKQVVFVLDRTGSMLANNKIGQAKSALNFCLDSLNANDRFNVITFNESPDVMSRNLMPASPGNIAKAHQFVNLVEASGGTNINDALKVALDLVNHSEGPQKMVVFITDGLPTIGETSIETILNNVRTQNAGNDKGSGGARLFCFGVGYDVNVPFLDRLAEQNHADADYVRPNENIESVVGSFYSKVASPVLSNIAVSFEGADTFDIYPKRMPDLFKGGQLVITGRYRGNPRGSVRLTGNSGQRNESFTLNNAFGESSAQSGLVSRIWAMRKIGFLLDEVRLHANKEVIDEIIRLSREYGIITPYTSYLADEHLDATTTTRTLGSNVNTFFFDRGGARTPETESRRELLELGRDSRGIVGDAETYRALNSKGYQSGGQSPAFGQGGFGGMGGGGGFGGGRSGGAPGAGLSTAGKAATSVAKRNQVTDRYADASELAKNLGDLDNKQNYQKVSETARVQFAANRAFYRRNNVWFDNNYASGQKVTQIQALSEAHFQLLRSRPELSKVATVGDEVVYSLGANAIQIGKVGKEKLTDAELKELLAGK